MTMWHHPSAFKTFSKSILKVKDWRKAIPTMGTCNPKQSLSLPLFTSPQLHFSCCKVSCVGVKRGKEAVSVTPLSVCTSWHSKWDDVDQGNGRLWSQAQVFPIKQMRLRKPHITHAWQKFDSQQQSQPNTPSALIIGPNESRTNAFVHLLRRRRRRIT